MLTRCYNIKSNKYRDYGARGITVCDSWRFGEAEFSGFDCFLRDMGDKPTGTQIDRINNELGYFKENCRWATPRQNGLNTRRNRRISAFGETLTLLEWSEKTGIAYSALLTRIDTLKWSVDDALTVPSRKVRT